MSINNQKADVAHTTPLQTIIILPQKLLYDYYGAFAEI
jgi:hypothetical protein